VYPSTQHPYKSECSQPLLPAGKGLSVQEKRTAPQEQDIRRKEMFEVNT